MWDKVLINKTMKLFLLVLLFCFFSFWRKNIVKKWYITKVSINTKLHGIAENLLKPSIGCHYIFCYNSFFSASIEYFVSRGFLTRVKVMWLHFLLPGRPVLSNRVKSTIYSKLNQHIWSYNAESRWHKLLMDDSIYVYRDTVSAFLVSYTNPSLIHD